MEISEGGGREEAISGAMPTLESVSFLWKAGSPRLSVVLCLN